MNQDTIPKKVTVALSALNEEYNICNLLKSVLLQIEDGYRLEKIIVISDGSTDKTADAVRSLGSDKIELIEHTARMGQSVRMDEAYKLFDSDILIQTDADVVFATNYVIRDLVKALVKEKNVMMCCGHAEPTKPKTFTEKAIKTTFDAYAEFKRSLKNGHNIFSVHGCIMAFKKDLIKNMPLNSYGIGNDLQNYLFCLESGFEYRYVQSAIVNFRLPASLKDQVKQNTRQQEARKRLWDEYNNELLKKEFYIPRSMFLKSTLKQALKHPVLTTYIFFVNKFCFLKSKYNGKKINGKWEIASSTKKTASL